MRCQALVLVLLVLASLSLAGYIHNRRKEELKLAKHASFQNVKHRVTKDVLKEYTTHAVETTSLLDKTKSQIKELGAEVSKAQEAADAKKGETETCTGELKRMTDEAAAINTEKTNIETEFQQKKASLEEQIANLKKEAEERSKVCDHIKKDSAEGKKLCKIEDAPVTPKPEEKKTDVKIKEKENAEKNEAENQGQKNEPPKSA